MIVSSHGVSIHFENFTYLSERHSFVSQFSYLSFFGVEFIGILHGNFPIGLPSCMPSAFLRASASFARWLISLRSISADTNRLVWEFLPFVIV